MKKLPVLLPLLSFFLLINSVPGVAQSYRFIIKVISADRNEPIEGASIKFEAKSNAHSETRFETADWEGMAYRSFDFYGTFTINAEAPGYYGIIQVVAKSRKDPNGDVPVTLVLKRRAGIKMVIVDVFERGTGKLIYDARVSLRGNNYSFNGTTNTMGQAIIAVDHGDDYEVTVSHAGYQSATGNVRVKPFDDTQNEYGLSFEMVATNEFKRLMWVQVQTRDKDGTMWGVPFASVIFKYEGTTFEQKANEEGITEFNHIFPPGEQVRIDVSMGGYKPQSKTVIIKASGAPSKGALGVIVANQEKDMAYFNLVKEEGLERTLYVKVIDDKGNIVKFADVNFPDDGLKITNAYGECVYTIKWPVDVPLKITAEKKGYTTGSTVAHLKDDNIEIRLIKKEGERTLNIFVKDEKGKAIPYADISFPDGNSKYTDMSGSVEYKLAAPTDETVKLQVEKKGYKPKSVEAGPGKVEVMIIMEKEPAQDANTEACDAADEAAFSKITGTWKSYRMHITISGSCNEVSGKWKVTEWCEGVDATNNASVARINGTFKGKMKNGTLQVSYESPPSPNNSKGTKGTGTLYLQSNGILNCSFGCTDGVLEKK